jgi:IS5 family transposase
MTRFKFVLADSAYDSRENFDFLEAKGIEPGIRVKRGASGKARGSWARRRAAREFLKGEERWKRKIDYGKRWIVEGVFSSFKRTFGEFVRAKKFEHMVREIVLKTLTYNLMLQLAKG